MKTTTFILAILCCTSTIFAQKDRGFIKKRYDKKDHIALVIGNSAYPDMPLENPKNDANAVADAFESMGFIVEKVIDADKEQMAEAIDRFAEKMKKASVAVFVFAGHGMQIDGSNFLIPIGRTASTQISKITQVPNRAINVNEVVAEMESNKVKFSLIVLDACRDNPIESNRGGKLKGLASINAPAGSLIMYATKAGDVAGDGYGTSKNSPFTTAFLQHIKTPGLDVNLLQSRITNTVLILTDGKQTPGAYSQITQSFTFVPEYSTEELEEIRKQKEQIAKELKQNISNKEKKKKQQEYDRLKKQIEQQENFEKENIELEKKQAEIDALDRQIADMKKNVADGEGDLDKMLEIIEKRKRENEKLLALKKQAEIERKKKENELALKKQKAEEERRKRKKELMEINEIKLKENLTKYNKIVESEFGKDLIPGAWNTVLKNMGIEKGSIKRDDINALREKIGLPTFKDFTVTDAGLNIKMRGIQGGTFTMGSDDCNNATPHTVTVSNFAIMKYEVTFAEYDKFCDATGRGKPDDEGWGRGSRPVINVSWHDAVAYAKWLSKKTGKTWRLPTEAEWEYAAKGGENCKYAGSDNIESVAWYTVTTNDKGTKPVGQKSPNGYGLYDMSGNVWEWCQDVYKSDFYSQSKNSTNPIYAGSGSLRVIRGGSWNGYSEYCRSADRSSYAPSYSNDYIGFRLAETN